MGVKGATKLLGDGKSSDLMDSIEYCSISDREDKDNPKNINNPNNRGIVIDAMHIIYQLSKGHLLGFDPIKNNRDESMTSCYKILEFICIWFEKYVIDVYDPSIKGVKKNYLVPIFIFDGYTSGAKKKTIKKRKERQKNASTKLESIKYNNNKDSDADTNKDTDNFVDMLEHKNTCIEKTVTRIKKLDSYNGKYYKNQLTKNIRDSYNPSNEISYIKLIFKWMGIPYIDAPNEADSQCAAIGVKYGIGTITGDIDVMLLGCSNIYKCVNHHNLQFDSFSLVEILEYMRLKSVDVMKLDPSFDTSASNISFNLVDLRSVCCMMGTDYCPGVKITQEKLSIESILWLYYKNNKNILDVMIKLRDERENIILELKNLGLIVQNTKIITDKKKSNKFSKQKKRNYIDHHKITNTYITQMLEAFNQYNREYVLDVSDTIFKLNKPDILQLTGFLSTFLNKESVSKIVEITQKAYECYVRSSESLDLVSVDKEHVEKEHVELVNRDEIPKDSVPENIIHRDISGKIKVFDLNIQPRFIDRKKTDVKICCDCICKSLWAEQLQ